MRPEYDIIGFQIGKLSQVFSNQDTFKLIPSKYSDSDCLLRPMHNTYQSIKVGSNLNA